MGEQVYRFTRKDLVPSWNKLATSFAHGNARGANDATKLALAEHIHSMPSGPEKERARTGYKFVFQTASLTNEVIHQQADCYAVV